MSKKLIRKGLAIGATASLTLAGLVGFTSPAFAAGNVWLEPAEGTTYNVPIASPFFLSAYFDDAAQAAAENVKLRVVAASGDLTLSTSGYGTNFSATANTMTVDGGAAVLALNTAETAYVATGSTTLAPTKNIFKLTPAKTSATFSVTAQAWMDLDGDGNIDSGEQASDVRTITFVHTDDITATSVVDAYGLNDSTVTASVKTTPVLNGQLLADGSNVVTGAITARFTNQLSTDVFNSTQTKWDETNQEWDVTVALPTVVPDDAEGSTDTVTITKSTHGLLAKETIKVSGLDQADANITATISTVADVNTFAYTATGVTVEADLIDGAGSESVQVVIGANNYSFRPYFNDATALAAATTTAVTAATASTATSTAPVSADQFKATGTNTLTITARKGKTVTFSYAVKTAAGASVGAGKSVRVTPSGLTGTLKLNGTTVANSTVINAVTDSAGSVSFTLTNTSASASDTVALAIVTEAVAGTTETVTVNWDDAVYEIVDLNDDAAFGTPKAVRAATKGGTYTFALRVQDQWRSVADGAVYRILATVTDRTAWTRSYSLSSGQVSVPVEDGGLNTNDTNVKFNIQKLVSGTWTTDAVDADVVDWDGLAGEEAAVDIKWYDQTDLVSLNADGVASADLSVTRTLTKTLAVDSRTSAAEAFDTTGMDAVTITGTVTNSVTGALKAGATITVSGNSSILFKSGGVTSFGTITLSDADGTFSIDAFSNTVLTDSVVTVTSGGASKTVKVSFIASTVVGEVDDLVVTGVKSIKAGRTSSVTVRSVDAYGNSMNLAATVSVSASGSGYLTSSPTAMVAGALSLTLVTGANDFGSSTITVTTGAGGVDNAIGTGDDDITKSVSIWVGPIANAKAGAKKGRVIVEAYRAKGKTVNVFVGATRVATFKANKANFRAVVKGVKSGTRNVSVRLSGPGEDFRGAITVK